MNHEREGGMNDHSNSWRDDKTQANGDWIQSFKLKLPADNKPAKEQAFIDEQIQAKRLTMK